MRRLFGSTQFLGLETEELRLGQAPFTDQINELGNGGHRGPGWRHVPGAFRRRRASRGFRRQQSRGVKPVDRLIEVQVAAAAGAGQDDLDPVAHLPVMGQEIKGPRDRVVHQSFANEDLRGVNRIDLPVADGACLDLQPVELRAAFHQHPAGLGAPERLRVADLEQVGAELEHPRGIEPGCGACKQARRLDNLGSHDPADCALGAQSAVRRRLCGGGHSPPPRLRFDGQHRTGKQIHLAVVGGFVLTVLHVPPGDVSKQAGQDASVDGPVGRRAEAQRERFLLSDLRFSIWRSGFGVWNPEFVCWGLEFGIRTLEFEICRESIPDRGQLEIIPLRQHLDELVVDVPPFAQAGVGEKVLVAKTTQPAL